jgi:hypothetical protein
MSTTIAFELDDDVAARLGDSPEARNAAAREATVLELYRRREIPDGRGARLLDLDLASFFKLAGSRFIPFIDLTPEELREELAALDRAWPRSSLRTLVR